MREVVVDGSALTVEDVVAVAHGQARATLGADVPRRMEASRSVVVKALRGGAPVYGVNTGFGALADTPVGEDDLTALQGAIVRSHAAAFGEPLDDQTVRALLLLRARTLAAGYSGVRVDLPARLLELLALDLLPVIPGKGSVGASGDLAQLAHLAQPLIGEGRLRPAGGPPAGRPAAEVLHEHGLEPLTLAPKEGLSLVNGTEPMQALLAFSVHDAAMVVQAADVACALSVEALLGTDRPYDERVQVIRPHPGQLASAANLRGLLAGSPLLASHRHSRHAVQDAYCLRCAPQVHGAVRDVLAFARQIIATELGAVVDNPVIVPDGEVMTTGNFHGEPLAFAADMLTMALAELASISERRVDRMLDRSSAPSDSECLLGGCPRTVFGRLVARRGPVGRSGLTAWWRPGVPWGGGFPWCGLGYRAFPGSRLGWPCRVHWGGAVPCRAVPGPVALAASPQHQRRSVVPGKPGVVLAQGSQPMLSPPPRCIRRIDYYDRKIGVGGHLH
jgi:histidine ammonia-lyase